MTISVLSARELVSGVAMITGFFTVFGGLGLFSFFLLPWPSRMRSLDGERDFDEARFRLESLRGDLERDDDRFFFFDDGFLWLP